jgi:hypothetical protein
MMCFQQQKYVFMDRKVFETQDIFYVFLRLRTEMLRTYAYNTSSSWQKIKLSDKLSLGIAYDCIVAGF